MIEKVIFWNIRSINIQNDFGKLMDLNRRHHYSFVALMEPSEDPSDLDQYKRKLGFNNAVANCSGKFGFFWKDDWEGTLLIDSIQHISMKFCKNNTFFIISSVYARCSALDKL